MAIFTQCEWQTMKAAAQEMPMCLGKLRRVVDDGNWAIYHKPDGNYFMAIAKPGSGCDDCVYGKREHVLRMLRTGRLNNHSLTRYGRRVLGVV